MARTMKLDFTPFADPQFSEELVAHLVEVEAVDRALHFSRLWAYYRNDLTPLGAGYPDGERHAEWLACAPPVRPSPGVRAACPDHGAVPSGVRRSRRAPACHRAKEIVIENDIGWRIDTAVHFLAGKPVGIESLARRPEQARHIESVLRAVWEASGGIALLQEIALLGGVYGFVDLVVRASRGRHRRKRGQRGRWRPTPGIEGNLPRPIEGDCPGCPESAAIGRVVRVSDGGAPGTRGPRGRRTHTPRPERRSPGGGRSSAGLPHGPSTDSMWRACSGRRARLSMPTGLPARKWTAVSIRQPMSFSMTISLRRWQAGARRLRRTPDGTARDPGRQPELLGLAVRAGAHASQLRMPLAVGIAGPEGGQVVPVVGP